MKAARCQSTLPAARVVAVFSPQVVLPLSPTQQLAMRRNVEKLIVEELGAAKARALLGGTIVDAAKLPADAPPVLATVRSLLAHVLPEQQIVPWLAELVDGRYR